LGFHVVEDRVGGHFPELAFAVAVVAAQAALNRDSRLTPIHQGLYGIPSHDLYGCQVAPSRFCFDRPEAYVWSTILATLDDTTNAMGKEDV